MKGTLVTGKGLVTANLESVALKREKERRIEDQPLKVGLWRWNGRGRVPLYKPRWVAQAFETRRGGGDQE